MAAFGKQIQQKQASKKLSMQNSDEFKYRFFLTISFFTLSFAIVFCVVLLNSQKILSPVASSSLSVNVLDEIIKPKIERTPNSYKLLDNRSILIPQAQASAGDVEMASAYVLTDFETGEVLLSKNLDKPLSVASLTKVMTAIVALDLADPGEIFSVTENAARKIPTKIGVLPYDKLTLHELLEASLLTSANDAAQVIADGIDKKYGRQVFVAAMNEKAKFLGLKNTSFSNPQGFDNRNNFSTVKDLAILTHYAMINYPEIAEIVRKDAEFLPEDTNHKQFDLPNWNGLINVYPEIIGMKIGNTSRAGKTTIVISERNGKKLVAIVLGAPGVLERDLWASQLLDYGYEKTLGLPKIEVTREELLAKYQTWYN